MIYDQYDELGKNNIKSTRSDFTDTVGEDGIKDIIRKVFTGGNVRDTTEFITQRRLLSSYAATYELFVRHLHGDISQAEEFVKKVSGELEQAKKPEKRTFYLWMLGLTKKGFDNIVRDNFSEYQKAFVQSLKETEEDISSHFGTLSGTLELDGVKVPLDWNFVLLLSLCLGSQTLSIRGSAKSMNGKLFEKLLLGSLISILGFRFLPEPPDEKASFTKEDKLFWLSNMDENERETDATLMHNGIAISIDIGFIGKGNPEISLDKVTRYNNLKRISGINHEMKTIIIVDTVAKNSDLINKAKRVDGVVLQMIRPDWTISFAKEVYRIFKMEENHSLLHKKPEELNDYFTSELKKISIGRFIS